MRKKTPRAQTPGLDAEGDANRALRRAYAQRKPWAVAAVQQAARDRLRAWYVAAQLVPGGVLFDPTSDTETPEEDAA